VREGGKKGGGEEIGRRAIERKRAREESSLERLTGCRINSPYLKRYGCFDEFQGGWAM